MQNLTNVYSGLHHNIFRAITINTAFGIRPTLEKKVNEIIPNQPLTSNIMTTLIAAITSTVIAMPFDYQRTLSQNNVSYKKITLSRVYQSYPAFAMRIIPHQVVSMTCLDLYSKLYDSYL